MPIPRPANSRSSGRLAAIEGHPHQDVIEWNGACRDANDKEQECRIRAQRTFACHCLGDEWIKTSHQEAGNQADDDTSRLIAGRLASRRRYAIASSTIAATTSAMPPNSNRGLPLGETR